MEPQEDRDDREQMNRDSSWVYQDPHNSLINNYLLSMSLSSQQWESIPWEDQFQNQFQNIQIEPQEMEEQEEKMVQRVNPNAIQFQEEPQIQLPRTKKQMVKTNQQNLPYKFPRLRDNNLKYLSQTLIAMIRHFQVMTYDQVFQRVNRDIGKKKSKKLRRRIYDALNVLKATDAIEVVDKTITVGSKYQQHPDQLDQQDQTEKNIDPNHSQPNQITQQLQRIKQKKAQLKKLIEYRQCLVNLIQTNKARDDEIEEKNKIRLPFLGVNGAGTTITYKKSSINTKIENYTEVKNFSDLQLIRLLHQNSEMQQQ